MKIKYYTKSEPKSIYYNDVKPTQIFGLGPYAPDINIYIKLTNNLYVDLEDGFIEEANDFSSPVYLYNVEWPNTAEILHSAHINDLKPGDVFDYFAILYGSHKRAMMCEDNKFIDLDKCELTPLEELRTLREDVYVLNYGIYVKGDYDIYFE